MQKTMEGNAIRTAGGQVWIFWLMAGVFIVLIQLATLKLYPVILQDGVQILDFGRVFLDPSTTWSTGWLVHESRPMLPVSYLGGAIQELAYAATAPSIMGVRVLSVISALLASAFSSEFSWQSMAPLPLASPLSTAW